MTEIWKDIEGYNGIYQISNLGRVKSLGNTKNKMVSKKQQVVIIGNLQEVITNVTYK